MKKIYLIAFALISALLTMANKGGRAASEGQGSTGAPGESTVCKNCHNGNIVVSMNLYLIDGNDTINSYEPSKDYEIHVVVTPVSGPTPKGFGFQLMGMEAPLKVSGPSVKTLTANSNNVKISNIVSTMRQYAEHNGNSLTNTFKINWTAPAKGTGPVSFYSASMGNNASNSDSGDGGTKTSVQINEKITTSTQNIGISKLNIYPNPNAGIFYISPEGTENLQALAILDLLGKPIRKYNYISGSPIDISTLNDGIYFVQFISHQGKIIVTKKIIKRAEKL